MTDITDILSHSGLRTRAIEELVSEGIAEPRLEQITAQQERILSNNTIDIFEDNSQPGYGFEKDRFKAFKANWNTGFDINYSMLGLIWEGMNYVENMGGVPSEMLSTMNTGEIAALYRAFGKLAKNGKIEVSPKKYVKAKELQGMKAEDAISEMMSYGCKRKAMGSLRKKGVTYFPTQANDLKRRITPLSQGVKDKFMALFDVSQYKEMKIDKATTKKYQAGKKEYIAAICELAHDIYERNTATQKA